MRYVSPITLLQLPAGSPFEKKDVLLAKKRLLAELELAGGVTIELNGKELSKNDIVDLFDGLDQPEAIAFHGAVARDEVLLHFLEGYTFENGAHFLDEPIYKESWFIDRIGPYFSDAFARYAIESFKVLDVEGWERLMSMPLLMDARRQEQCWLQIEAAIEKKVHELEALKQRESLDGNYLTLVEQLCDHRTINMILLLPEERFGSVRDEYAFGMMQVLIDVFNKKNRNYAMETLLNAKILAHNEVLKQQIDDKYLEMVGIMKQRGSSGTKKGSDWTAARLIFFVFFIIIQIARSCDRDDKPINFNSFKVEPYKVDYEKLLEAPKVVPEDSIAYAFAPADAPMSALQNMMTALHNKTPLAFDSSGNIDLKPGTDSYRSIWNNALFKEKEGRESVKEQSFEIRNVSELDAIVFVRSGKKVYSAYVPSMDLIYIKLTEGINTMYVYLGNKFNKEQGFTFYNWGRTKELKVKGIFTRNVIKNKTWLERPFEWTVKSGSTDAGMMVILGNKNEEASIRVQEQ